MKNNSLDIGKTSSFLWGDVRIYSPTILLCLGRGGSGRVATQGSLVQQAIQKNWPVIYLSGLYDSHEAFSFLKFTKLQSEAIDFHFINPGRCIESDENSWKLSQSIFDIIQNKGVFYAGLLERGANVSNEFQDRFIRNLLGEVTYAVEEYAKTNQGPVMVIYDSLFFYLPWFKDESNLDLFRIVVNSLPNVTSVVSDSHIDEIPDAICSSATAFLVTSIYKTLSSNPEKIVPGISYEELKNLTPGSGLFVENNKPPMKVKIAYPTEFGRIELGEREVMLEENMLAMEAKYSLRAKADVSTIPLLPRPHPRI